MSNIFDEEPKTPLNFKEFDKLVNLVEEAGWEHKINDLHGGKQIKIYNDTEGLVDDAVIHQFSNGRQGGLLETYILGECRGWETAEEVFEGWKERMSYED